MYSEKSERLDKRRLYAIWTSFILAVAFAAAGTALLVYSDRAKAAALYYGGDGTPSSWEYSSVYSDTEVVDTCEEVTTDYRETATDVSESEIASARKQAQRAMNITAYRAVGFVGGALIAFAIAFGVAYVVLASPLPTETPPEASAILAPAAAFAPYIGVNDYMAALIAPAITAASLYGVRSLVRLAIYDRMTPYASLPARLSRSVSKTGGEGILRFSPIVHLLFFTSFAAASISLLCAAAKGVELTIPTYAYAAVFFLAAVYDLASLYAMSRDAAHLCRQLDAAFCDREVEIRGEFANEEEKLAGLTKRRREAVDSAVKSERFKVELISNVSHDLRTPLTAIIGYGELLRGEAVSADGAARLELLNKKAAYMKDLVDSLFELTKVSSGVLPPKPDNIDLLRLIEQTAGVFDDQLAAAGLTLRRRYSAETIPIRTDGGRLHAVLANLFVNAIKYSLSGTRVYIDASSGGGKCTVRIVNTSSYEMNFTPDDITRRFVTGDVARTSGGSGLGLAIAKTYTESLGGRFKVEIDGDQFAALIELPLDIESNL